MAQTQATSGAARRQCAAILFSSWVTTGPQTSENEGQYRPSAASQGPVESTPAMSLTYLSRMRSRVRVPSSPPAKPFINTEITRPDSREQAQFNQACVQKTKPFGPHNPVNGLRRKMARAGHRWGHKLYLFCSLLRS